MKPFNLNTIGFGNVQITWHIPEERARRSNLAQASAGAYLSICFNDEVFCKRVKVEHSTRIETLRRWQSEIGTLDSVYKKCVLFINFILNNNIIF